MNILYTKNGHPLQKDGDNLFSQSGQHVAKVRDGYAFSQSGRYIGTIAEGRLVYRSTDSARISSPFVQMPHAGIAVAPAIPAAMLGDEPSIASL